MLKLDIVLFSFLGSLILNFFLKKRKLLLDIKYSQHKLYSSRHAVPLSGGVVIMVLSLIFLGSFDLISKSILFLIFLVGFFSDTNLLSSPSKRFILQAFTVLLFIYMNDIMVGSLRVEIFDNLLQHKFINYIFLLICILILINGTNFIDGLNTLVIGYFLSVIITVIFTNYNSDLDYQDINLKIYLAILIPLFFLNLFGYLYLGDSGSYLLSFIVGYILIDFSNHSENISPYFIAVLLWYPAYENLFSIIRKILKKISITTADSKHLHHLLFSYLKFKFKKTELFTNSLTALIINSYNVIIFIISIQNISQTKNLILLIFISIMIYNSLYYFLIKNDIKN